MTALEIKTYREGLQGKRDEITRGETTLEAAKTNMKNLGFATMKEANGFIATERPELDKLIAHKNALEASFEADYAQHIQ